MLTACALLSALAGAQCRLQPLNSIQEQRQAGQHSAQAVTDACPRPGRIAHAPHHSDDALTEQQDWSGAGVVASGAAMHSCSCITNDLSSFPADPK